MVGFHHASPHGLTGPINTAQAIMLIPIRVMSSVVTLVLQKIQESESDFRSKHTSIRMNSKSIAFYRGEHGEIESLNEKLGAVISGLLILARRKTLFDVGLLVVENLDLIAGSIFAGWVLIDV